MGHAGDLVRLLLNREAVRQNKPLVDCAMYELQVQVTTVLPGRTPCLACLYPEEPPASQRTFPVFGADTWRIRPTAANPTTFTVANPRPVTASAS